LAAGGLVVGIRTPSARRECHDGHDVDVPPGGIVTVPHMDRPASPPGARYLQAGDDWEHQITIRDRATAPGLDLTGVEWASELRRTARHESATPVDVDTTDADTGVLVLRIPSDLTRHVAPGDHVLDLRATAPRVVTVYRTRVIVEQPVTRLP